MIGVVLVAGSSGIWTSEQRSDRC